MAKDDVIEVEGIVKEALPNAQFIVEIQGGHKLHAHIASGNGRRRAADRDFRFRFEPPLEVWRYLS